jgi:hypothetical protein
VTIKRPGLTEEESATSPGLLEVALPSFREDEDALLSNEPCVIVDVDAERDLSDDDVPRWVSLSSAAMDQHIVVSTGVCVCVFFSSEHGGTHVSGTSEASTTTF